MSSVSQQCPRCGTCDLGAPGLWLCKQCKHEWTVGEAPEEQPYWLCCGSQIYHEHHKAYCYPDRRRWGTKSQHEEQQRACPKHPNYVLSNCPECASPSHRPGAVRYVENETTKPVHRIGVSFIAAVPNGAKLMAFNDQIFLVAPGMAPCFVTPTGLVPVQQADGSDLK